MIPAHRTTKGVRPPTPPVWGDPWTCPPIPFKGPAPPPQGASKGPWYLFSLPHNTSPSKALPEFLIWLPINFYWLKSPRSQVGNKSKTLRKKIPHTKEMSGTNYILTYILVLYQGQFCSLGGTLAVSGDSFERQDWLGRGCHWRLVSGGQRCCSTSYSTQDGPPKRTIWYWMSTVLNVRNAGV